MKLNNEVNIDVLEVPVQDMFFNSLGGAGYLISVT